MLKFSLDIYTPLVARDGPRQRTVLTISVEQSETTTKLSPAETEGHGDDSEAVRRRDSGPPLAPAVSPCFLPDIHAPRLEHLCRRASARTTKALPLGMDAVTPGDLDPAATLTRSSYKTPTNHLQHTYSGGPAATESPIGSSWLRRI